MQALRERIPYLGNSNTGKALYHLLEEKKKTQPLTAEASSEGPLLQL